MPRPRKQIETSAITGHSIRSDRRTSYDRCSLRETRTGSAANTLRREMAQHVLQDAAILEVIEFVERIDAAEQRNALECAVRSDDFGDQPLARLQITVQAADRHRFIA